jgi:hypothetical protein
MEISINITVESLQRKLKVVNRYERAHIAKHVQLPRRQLLALLALARRAKTPFGSELERVQQLTHKAHILLTHAEMRHLLTLALEAMQLRTTQAGTELESHEVSVSDPYDVFLWPDGHWCYRSTFSPSPLRSDDFQVIARGTSAWGRYSGRPPGMT